ncbi:MAG: type II/IV secretion system protein [Parcubacteria group bacterium]|nr:type II/IV secretion system protein [Parcubacteria group bacterium]
MTLLQQLTKKDVLNTEQVDAIKTEMRSTAKTAEDIILEKKIISEKVLFEVKGEVLNVPFQSEFIEEIPNEVISIIPRESANFYKMVPLRIEKTEKILNVGMVYPENIQANEALKFLARQHHLQVVIYLITVSDFKKYFAKYQAVEQEMEKVLENLEEEVVIQPEDKETLVAKEKYGRLVEEAPVIKMVGVILRQAVEGSASDIHIEATADDLRVRYRLDGLLYSSLILPKKVHSAIVARIKILSRLKIDETRLPQDGRFSAVITNKKVDFRVAVMPTTMGEKVVLRVLDPSAGVDKLSDLGLSGRNFDVIEKVVKQPYGMILVTGPTGSGKTTTLYTVLRQLNKEEVNIVTLEDPVEYFMGGINQSQVNPDIDFGFSNGLRQILRQDPDIIMVGEIRDEETANLAIHAALTGHLVLSTLHTTSAIGVIPRLIDMGITPFLIPSTLSVAVSQRLARVLCPHCKKKVKLTGNSKQFVLDKLKNMPALAKKDLNLTEPLMAWQFVGCKKCNSKGYSGRVGVFEVLEISEKISDIILKGVNERELFKEARVQGMVTMDEDGILKVLKGVTSLEEIMRITQE